MAPNRAEVEMSEPVRLRDRVEQPRLHLAEADPDGVVQGGVGQAEVERRRHRRGTGTRHVASRLTRRVTG
jgi:hypothetical protein